MVKITHSDSNSADLNADNCLLIEMDTTKKKLAPQRYNHLILVNNDGLSTLQVKVNGGIENGNTLVGQNETIFVPPESVLEIEPEDGIIFSHIVIKNTHSTHNISADDIVWTIKNF